MKLNTFISLYNVRIKSIDNLNSNIIMEIVNDLVKPLSYLSFDDKIKIVKKTINDSKNEEFPTPYYYRNLIINLISAYTNIEMDANGFDTLSENKLIDVILNLFEPEYKICSSLLQMCLSDMESG